MDNAVALVQAYLRVNGYFTVAEYPVLEALKDRAVRTVTDIDILGFRFPGAGRLIISKGRRAEADLGASILDPELGVSIDCADMIVGEVKEGHAVLNRAAYNPLVLRIALRRFGCCGSSEVGKVVQELIRRGRTMTPCGHQLRLVAFGSILSQDANLPFRQISLQHITEFLLAYIREHWDAIHQAQFKDPAFGFLVTLEKARLATSPPG